MDELNQLLRNLPKIDRLMQDSAVEEAVQIIGRGKVVEICRRQVALAKDAAVGRGVSPDIDTVLHSVQAEIIVEKSRMINRVINGTGVLIHTNLGRSPLGETLFDELGKLISGYCNLEINVRERQRGVRGDGVLSLLAQLCNAEDAVVVNNNAAALFLLLSAMAAGKEVIVSRGELVQIGGGFRIPDILRSAGARLVEVGTTNITTIEDYKSALNEETALILKVHQANFSMDGFVSNPTVAELKNADLAVPVVVDLGSGNVVHQIGDTAVFEPTPADSIRSGADLVCFSTDKMLGAGQGGVVVGRSNLIQLLKKHPVMRVVRVDKITFGILQTFLSYHLHGKQEMIPLWKMASLSQETLRLRVERFLADHTLNAAHFSPTACLSTFGGGSTPNETIPSFGLAITSAHPEAIASFLQKLQPPVVGTVKSNVFTIDFRTLFENDLEDLASSCHHLEDAGLLNH